MLFPDEPFAEINHPWFVVGVNYHVIGVEGSDIGPNPILRRPTSFDAPARSRLARDFARFRAWGVKVVRIWAMEHGEGLEWSRGGRPLVTGVDPTFLSNVDHINRLARQHSLRIYWTLLVAGDFEPVGRVARPAVRSEEPERDYRSRLDRARMRNGFSQMLFFDRARDCFFQNAVRPFLTALEGCRGGVFAVDLVNEPDMLWRTSIRNVLEALMREFGLRGFTLPGSLRDLNAIPDRLLEHLLLLVLRAVREELPPTLQTSIESWILDRTRNELYEQLFIGFLASLGTYIRDRCNPRPLVSTGFGFANTILRYHTTFERMFDFWDFHHYNTVNLGNQRILLEPFRRLRLNKPCLLGECGLGGHFQDETLGLSIDEAFNLGRPVTVRDVFERQASCVDTYFHLSSSQGYAGCLVWDYGGQLDVVRDSPLSLTSLGRSIPRRPGATCPARSRDTEGECGWGLRYPLVWKRADTDRASERYCFHAAGEPSDPDHLCGRLAAARIHAFMASQRRQGRAPS